MEERERKREREREREREKNKNKVLPGFEPGTFCVLSRCDNHYTTRPHDILAVTSTPAYTTKMVPFVSKQAQLIQWPR